MAECKPDEKSTGEVDLTSMSTVIKIILSAFSIGQKPALSLPPPIALLSNKLKPGMSPRNLAARQMAKAESIGNSMSNIFEDGPNKAAQQMLSDAEESIGEVRNAKVEGFADLGAVQSAGSGSAGPIPVFVTSTNVVPIKVSSNLA